MQRFITSRRTLIPFTILLLLLVASFSTAALVRNASAATPNPYVSLSGSFTPAPASAHLRGRHTANGQVTISVLLQPHNGAQMTSLLAALYNQNSSQYHQWLAKGQFNTLFAPAASQVAQVRNFLTQAGLKMASSPTPFLLRASGTTAQVEAAFHTTIHDYTAANGQTYFQNDSAIQIPASLSGMVVAVSGLSNTVRPHSHAITTAAAAKQMGKAIPQYGAGPGGSGLVPSQTASLYGATQIYKKGDKGMGKGATLAVFELSGYTPADVAVYEHQFFGPSENVQLQDINVDGGPVTPICPTGDECGPFGPPPCANGCDSADFTADVEVEADVETQIALAPKIDRVMVYNAPNDFNGITTTDEYFQIANDDAADSISSSWGLCEQDAGLAQAQTESVAFAQMAIQGQSMFTSSGDTGAFDCLRGSGFTGLTVEDPASQPFVTGVGGTSFSSFDPGTNLHPSYPATGFETVWNVLNRCKNTPAGLTNCANLGADGGGVSAFWPKPSYQHGPGVITSFSQQAPFCSQATSGQFCREVPDISANADEFTPYAEFCLGDPNTNSGCATFAGARTPPGWFGIGGTSLSSPLWSAVIALWDSVHGKRFGSANFGLYDLFRSNDAFSKIYHDITGKNQTENNNGFYPVTKNFDMAVGIGTPMISNFARSKP